MILVSMLSLFLSNAYAEGKDIDLTILQPSFSQGGMLGFSGLQAGEYGYFRYGIYTHLVQDPLVYYEDNIDQGAIVARRLLNQLGGEFDFSQNFGASFSLPVALQWSSEIPSMSRNGFGIGDFRAGIFANIWRNSDVRTGVKMDIFLPTSTNQAWLGEVSPRASFLGNVVYDWNQFEIFGQSGIHFRSPVNTDMDFAVDSELLLDVGLRWNLWPEQYALATTYQSRHGFNNFFRGGAENTGEISSSLQKWQDNTVWQFGFSRGIHDGYGSSEFQFFLGYTIHNRPDKEIDEIIYVPPPEDEPVIIEEPPVEEITNWEEEELAKVEADQIIIRDNIQFEVGTDRILEESRPTLDYIATLINQDVQIGHVVIEGHASAEGLHEYNYDLSNLRARAIFKALVQAGVHPDRLSHRGYGEALPKVAGETEEAFAQNRRVEFLIIRQDPPDTVLDLRELQSAPWAETLLKFIIPEPIKEEKPDINESYEGEIFQEIDSLPTINESENESNNTDSKPDSENNRSQGEEP